MATITKTFGGKIERAAVDARAVASVAMTPQERCRAMMARIVGASSYDIVRGRVY
jgi:hypothetical protein